MSMGDAKRGKHNPDMCACIHTYESTYSRGDATLRDDACHPPTNWGGHKYISAKVSGSALFSFTDYSHVCACVYADEGVVCFGFPLPTSSGRGENCFKSAENEFCRPKQKETNPKLSTSYCGLVVNEYEQTHTHTHTLGG